MKLIADSGSTKTAWKLTSQQGETKTFFTAGLNPFFRTEEEIYQEVLQTLIHETADRVDEIFFYGAGVVNAEKGAVVSRALNRIYRNARIETHSDALGAARALFGSKAGIACILGTGSNVCLYDGEKIADGISPLGFILGDEGSGAVMGRQLLGDYFKQVMPESISEAFGAKYQLSREEALNRVYRTEKPNQFLAQFVPFLSENLASDYCYEFVARNFTSFFERNVTKLPGFSSYPIGFAGSVAWHFGNVLKPVAAKFGYNELYVIKDPIDGLEKYHTTEI
jgi:N-acetylglucosamine kinase-like BadF-type ATPase